MNVVRFGLAVCAWASLAFGDAVARLRIATVWVDLPAAIESGGAGILALTAWGTRSRWEGDAIDDRQRFADSCGPAALRAVLRHRGLSAPQELLWSLCRVPGGGTTLGRLAAIAQRFGFECRLAWDPELERVHPPAVVHLARGHFVVLERRTGGCVRILDPACGRVRVSVETLRREASGALLVFPATSAASGAGRTPERRSAW